MKRQLLSAVILSIVSAVSGQSQVNVPLTIEEALYPGDPTGTRVNISNPPSYMTRGGIARENASFCVSVPIPDSAGLRSLSGLSLTGVSVQQFRVLGSWPDGNYQWVEACGTIASFTAGSLPTVTLTNSGSGSGNNMATDNGATIQIATGAATFTVRKANFNGLDAVTAGSTPIVLTGSSDGFVIMGPASPATSCGTCTTPYKSSNDPQSTVVIEKNGPVEVVLKANFQYKDASGNAYARGTVRMYFHNQQSDVRIRPVLQNADYGTNSTFATAYKGMQAYEFRVGANPSVLSGALTYKVANHTGTPTSGTMSGSDYVTIYQGQSNYLNSSDCPINNSVCANYFTTDQGYVLAKNGSPILTGTPSQYPQGWVDVSTAGGAGIEIGMDQFSSRWPASLEFRGGGTDVRVGIFASENSSPIYQSWPQWSLSDFWVSFHSAAPASLATEFFKYQHRLLGHASMAAYNSAAVFPYLLNDPTAEDNYMTSLANSANPSTGGASSGCCVQDYGTVSPNFSQFRYRDYSWHADGGPNQAEFRWSNILNFIKRDMPGRYLDSQSFYEFQGTIGWAHSDGFTWQSYPSQLDGFGEPATLSANSNLANCPVGANGGNCAYGNTWGAGANGQEHWHGYGMGDYYFLSGDEFIKDALVPMKDYFTNNNTYEAAQYGGDSGTVNVSGTTVSLIAGPSFGSWMLGQNININGQIETVTAISDPSHISVSPAMGSLTSVIYGSNGGVYNSRSVGVYLMWYTRYARYLQSIGDSGGAATVLANGARMFDIQVKNPLCLNGYPAGCSVGALLTPSGSWHTQGVSPVRGVHLGSTGPGGDSVCGYNYYYRVEGAFQQAILAQGILELRAQEGSGWSDYWTSLDLAYGISQFLTGEQFVNTNNNWYDSSSATFNGFRFGVLLDVGNAAAVTPNHVDCANYPATAAMATIWGAFLAQAAELGTVDPIKFKIAVWRGMAALGVSDPDFGQYELSYAINAVLNPSGNMLQTQAITSFADNGGGSYTIGWTTPPGTQYLRVKWGPKQIVDLIGYDSGLEQFIGNPATTQNWFASPDAPGIPSPAAGSQSMTIATGVTGLTAANFSIKAFAPSSGGSPALNLVSVSGNGQTGGSGQTLGNPFIIKATDANGNPVAGVTVTFMVTAGGGTLSATTVGTSTAGTASSTLTLGASAGANTVVVSSGTLSGSPITFTATGTGGSAPASIAVVSGNGQAGSAGQALANPFMVRVMDGAGNAVSGVAVTFAITAGGGSLSSTSATTNSSGTVSSVLTLGIAPGTNTVMVSSGSLSGSPITFTATGTGSSPAANLVMVSGNQQTGTAGQSLPSQFVVKATDSSGNPVSGITVNFAVAAGGGTLSVSTATTNSLGTASSTLTLGPSAGTDTVTATSGTLSGSPVTFAATAGGVPAGSVPSVSWTTQVRTNPWPAFIGWATSLFDPISQQTIWYLAPANYTGIYSTTFFFYNSTTDTFTNIGGTSSTTDACPVDTSSMPGDRHPMGQMALDTKRNMLWLYGGVNMTCTPNPHLDMYYLTLNSNPTLDTWHQVTPAHIPLANGPASMVYDPDDDVLFAFGSDVSSQTHDNWVYCRTLENSTPGILTGRQSAAGCANPDDWTLVAVAAGLQPPGVAYPGLVYDIITKTIIQYGGQDGGGNAQNQTWAYSVPTQTWTQKALSTAAPPLYTGPIVAMPAMAYNSTTGKILYHQTSNSGAPADWQYDPVSDTWAKLPSTGGGSPIDAIGAYDAVANVFLTWNKNVNTGFGDIWKGTLTSGGTPVSACDLNSDGVINQLDVQIAVQQVVSGPCSTANLIGTGQCNVIDVQRVINASAGAGCRTGQ